jgi:hypothetical protein
VARAKALTFYLEVNPDVAHLGRIGKLDYLVIARTEGSMAK